MSRAGRRHPRGSERAPRASGSRGRGAGRPVTATLGNGLRVLLQPMRQAPLVSVWCWYRVGSRDERPGLTGLSHWAEHMNFKGTRRIPREEITRQVELAGGLWNGYTWLDVTTYFETVGSGAFEAMLRLEASRMSECLYAPREVERERHVVISELQGGENDPRTFLEREVSGTALQAHPYRWPTIGYHSDLLAITRDDLYRHYRAYYCPGNAILVAAGDFEAGAALALVRRHFGRIPRGPAVAPIRTIEGEQSGERRVRVRRPAGAAYVHLAWPAPAAADRDFATLLVADGILAGGPTVNLWSGAQGRGPSKASRLYRALVDGGLASEISTAVIPTRYPYLYSIQATVRAGIDPARVEEAIEAEVAALGREGGDAADLDRARNQFMARYALESESVTDVAHQLGFFETIGDHRLWIDLPRRVEAVTPDMVARYAATRLDEHHRTVGILHPDPPESAP
jgi:zinc protease